MDWKGIPVLGNHVKLLTYRNYVYKIKFKYKKINEDKKAALLDIVSESAGQQTEDVLRAVLYRIDRNMVQIPIQSEHFIFYPQILPWPLGQQVMFTIRGESFNCNPQLILLDIVWKEICITANQKDGLEQTKHLEHNHQVQATTIQSQSLLSNMHKLGFEKQNMASCAEFKSLPTKITNVPTLASARTSNVNNAMPQSQKSKESDVSSEGKGRKCVTNPLQNALKSNCAISISPVALLVQVKTHKSHVMSKHEKTQENLASACTTNFNTDAAEKNSVNLDYESLKTTSEKKKRKHCYGYLKNQIHDAKTTTGDTQISLRKKRNHLSLEVNNLVSSYRVKGRKNPLETIKNDDGDRCMMSSEVSFDMSDKDVIEICDGGSIVYESESIEGNEEGVVDAQRRKQGWDKEDVLYDSQRVDSQDPIRLRGKRDKKQRLRGKRDKKQSDEADIVSKSVIKSPNSFIVTRNQVKSNPVGISRSTNSLNINSPPGKGKCPGIKQDHLESQEIVSKRKGSVVKRNQKVKDTNGSHYNEPNRMKSAAQLCRPKSQLFISPNPKHQSNNQPYDEDKQQTRLSQSLSSIHSLRSTQSPNPSLSQSSYRSLNSSQSSSSCTSIIKQTRGTKHKQRVHSTPVWLSKDDVWLFSGAPKELHKLGS